MRKTSARQCLFADCDTLVVKKSGVLHFIPIAMKRLNPAYSHQENGVVALKKRLKQGRVTLGVS